MRRDRLAQVPAAGRHDVTDVLGQRIAKAFGVLSFSGRCKFPGFFLLAAAPGQVRMLTITKELHGGKGMTAEQRSLLVPGGTIHASLVIIPVAQVRHSSNPPSIPHERTRWVRWVLYDANLIRLDAESEYIGDKPVEGVRAGHTCSGKPRQLAKSLRKRQGA